MKLPLVNSRKIVKALMKSGFQQAPKKGKGSHKAFYRIDEDGKKFLVVSFLWVSSTDGELYNGTDPSFAISILKTGSHTISLMAQDDLGVWSEPAAMDIEIVTPAHPPTAAITSPANGSTVSGTVTIQGTASDTNGDDTIQKVEISVDGGSWTEAVGTTTWTYSLDSKGISDGDHSIRLRSYDGVDHSDIQTITITVKNDEGTSGDGEDEGLIPGFSLVQIIVSLATIILLSRRPGARRVTEE